MNLCKPYSVSAASVHRLVVSAEDDPELETPKISLLGKGPTRLQQKQLDDLLGQFGDVLTDKPRRTCILHHEVNTGGSPPIRSAPYQVAERLRESVKKELEGLCEMGILETSVSPWSSPIVPVAKKDGSIRLCVDFRKVNKVTVPDPYYIPMVGEIVDRVAGAQYLSKLDLNKGFHQVPLSEEAKQRAAIVTPFGKFQFTMMPFGMINATSTFQRLMDEVLRGKQDRCSAYIDDILIYSSSWGEHLAHVKETLMCLRRARLTAKWSKCEWGKEQLEYLGHRIGGGIVEVPEARVKAMAEFRQPVTKKDVRAFLGTTGYYRKFIPGYGVH